MNVTQPISVITVVFETLQCLVVSLNRVAVIGIVCDVETWRAISGKRASARDGAVARVHRRQQR